MVHPGQPQLIYQGRMVLWRHGRDPLEPDGDTLEGFLKSLAPLFLEGMVLSTNAEVLTKNMHLLLSYIPS